MNYSRVKHFYRSDTIEVLMNIFPIIKPNPTPPYKSDSAKTYKTNILKMENFY